MKIILRICLTLNILMGIYLLSSQLPRLVKNIHTSNMSIFNLLAFSVILFLSVWLLVRENRTWIMVLAGVMILEVAVSLVSIVSILQIISLTARLFLMLAGSNILMVIIISGLLIYLPYCPEKKS